MLTNKKVYKIGTRGSLLARTQCQQIKKELEELTGEKFELEIIKTQGDLNTSVPLWQMEGKDFFTKELDEALLGKKVDLVVHSYKDLGSERPSGIELAAITKRSYAQDIFLIPQENLEKIIKGDFKEDTFIVGTSSPRRIVNAENHLGKILPSETLLDVKAKMLRGNVNTRIQKLKNGEFHGIILAMAGLERLAKDEKATEEMTPLLKGLNFAIMPQFYFPPAASQGALGIECRADDSKLKEKLALVNHSDTIEEVKRERRAFQSFGGGCHLAVGINVRKHKDFFIHHQRGEVDGKKIEIHLTEGNEQALEYAKKQVLKEAREGSILAFLGMPKRSNDSSETSKEDDQTSNIHYVYDQVISKNMIHGDHELINSSRKVFVTTRYAKGRLPQKDNAHNLSLWAAGHKTWENLARQGYWFQGCSEGLGHLEIDRLSRESSLIQLLHTLNFDLRDKHYTVLSHKDAQSPLGPIVESYDRKTEEDFESGLKDKIEKVSCFYWSSKYQAKRYLELFPNIKDKIHFCGHGKTYDGLKELEMSPIPLCSIREYKEFLNQISKEL